ncbi:PREDICTED: probable multidrug resistance-associated protein lethal(2)03659 [Nicrophorus vespilloides]|uniref:Probable multidrug resistance-associated protein lethal(2)03659 n=1 Tax=Nicrophorus vespilloides TaxID=110193 RepID=A0ABM1MRF7_NICVS|nr:PREDICTED: probable multidrug resistance-associated protein lethal(2)03659 [Nicrophorus vespilloides]
MYQAPPIKRNTNPKEKAGFFNVLTFLFTYDIFKKSSKRELIETDVYNVLNDYRASKLGDDLEREWEIEKKKPHTSLTKTMFRVYGKSWMMYGFTNLIVKSVTLVTLPLATGKLVSYFASESTMSINEAYIYGSIVIFCTFVQSIYTHSYMLSLTQLGLKVRTALSSLIYRKSLKLTSSSLISFSSGKIVTMVSKDVLVFESALIFAHDLWIGLIQVGFMTYIMYQKIKWAAILGISFLIFLIPFQIMIAKRTTSLRLKTSGKTDERLRRIQEILTSIKLIKLYTWEKYYTKITNALRINEMSKLRSIFYLKSVILSMSAVSQRLSFYICILAFIYMGNAIDAEIVFVVISCFGSLKFVLSVAIPMSVSQMAEAKSSLKRIKNYLLVEDTDSIDKQMPIIREVNVSIKNASVEILNKSILSDVNLKLQPSLIGVTGSVGGGKSTLLKMIMHDVHMCDGGVSTSGDYSYASQEPWLFPGTIKQNILFGLPYERERYQQVIRVCALTRDLLTFPKRDNTIVSDKGLNLSKGQQARINLARTIYKKCDIYLLDDTLNALDASVSKFVFHECMRGFLKGKLCVVVCHNKMFLEDMDRILVIDQGSIKGDGSFDDLQRQGIDFGSNANEEGSADDVEEVQVSPVRGKEPNEKENADENCNLLVSTLDMDNTAIYNETKQVGRVSMDVYKHYLHHAGGWKTIPFFLILCLLGQCSLSYFDYYITKWLSIEQELSKIKTNSTYYSEDTLIEAEAKHVTAMYTYSIIIVVATTLTVLRLFTFFGLTTMASKTLHHKIFSRITSACMSFFDRNLSGNILNRFSKDFGVVDEYLPYAYFECVRIFFVLTGVVTVLSFVNPYLLLPTSVVLVILLYARVVFLKTSRSLRRLDGTTRSPVIGYLNSTLEGLSTIRASGKQETLKMQFDEHQDLNTSAAYMYIATSRAFGFWLDILCSIYIAIIVFSFILLDSSSIIAGNVGLAITQSFGLTGILQWGIRQWTEVETMMTSVERIVEYSNAEQEDMSGEDPDNWPKQGLIEYRNVTLKYTNSDKKVLDDVNFVIQPKEKIGIIGRTGAGKSSIISVLFRLYDIHGSIIIDDVDIKDIELEIVRSKISIIPQDPVLFAGTLRSNLDPHDQHTDNELWNTLGEIELKHVVEGFEMGLSSVVSEGGANFSVGQRQLICLARAILRNNKILVLDEATANIDPQTDALVQKTIARLFSDCTILTIAHRLNTIINSDKIMVVDFGSVVEFDTPKALLDKRQGIFYSLAKQSGLVN